MSTCKADRHSAIVNLLPLLKCFSYDFVFLQFDGFIGRLSKNSASKVNEHIELLCRIIALDPSS